MVLAAGTIVIELPTWPFDHWMYPLHWLVVESVTDSPKHKLVFDAVTTGASGFPTVIVIGVEAELVQLPTLHVAV